MKNTYGPRVVSTARDSARTDRSTSLVITQQVVPDYRVPFFRQIARSGRCEFVLVAGESNPALDCIESGSVVTVAERAILGGRLFWQSGAFRCAVSAEVGVLTFNPRVISNLPILVARRILRRPTLLWGHAWSRSGRASRSNRLRRLLCRISSGVIAYTPDEAQELRDAMPGLRVWAASNALYPRSEIVPPDLGGDRCDVVVCSRLIEEKKPRLALDAFAIAASVVPELRLVFVGEGPLRTSLEQRAGELGLGDRVVFQGAVFGHPDLAAVYGRALVSLSPGCVGLSITQSLGFGTPMIYALSENHGPEIALADEGFNSIGVASDDAKSMAAAIVDIHAERHEWQSRRSAISERCRDTYSIEEMARGFLAAVDAVAPRWRRRQKHGGDNRDRSGVSLWSANRRSFNLTAVNDKIDYERQARMEREAAAYNDGRVMENNLAWHRRFSHVFEAPDSVWGEARLSDLMREKAVGADALDVGCGPGNVAKQLHDFGAKTVVGFDVSSSEVERARSDFGHLDGVSFFVGGGASDVHGEFDLIAGRAILHHIDFKSELEQFFENNLRPGGRMVFLEPMSHPMSLAFQKLVPSAHTEDEWPITPSDARFLAQRFGAVIEPINFLTFPAGVISTFIFNDADNALTRAAHRADRKLASRPAFSARGRYGIIVIDKPSGC